MPLTDFGLRENSGTTWRKTWTTEVYLDPEEIGSPYNRAELGVLSPYYYVHTAS
jgi:hypothetical protein